MPSNMGRADQRTRGGDANHGDESESGLALEMTSPKKLLSSGGVLCGAILQFLRVVVQSVATTAFK